MRVTVNLSLRSSTVRALEKQVEKLGAKSISSLVDDIVRARLAVTEE